MGRKKGRGDTEPELLQSLAVDFNPQRASDPLELLDACVVALQDWRAATREAALTAIAGALEGLPTLHKVDTRCFILFAFCGISVKKGSIKEQRLAFRAVGLLALTLRSGASWVLDEAFPLILKKIQAPAASHDDAPTHVAAIDCLAAATFAGARDAEDVERSVKAVWAVIVRPVTSGPTKKKTSSRSQSQVVAAAVSAWTFLITTTTTDVPRKAAATVVTLADLLDHDDRAVRMAAGEALAVCVELNLTQHNPRKDMEALQAKVSELAGEAAGKGANNTLLPEQKYLFRQVAAFLDHDERPRETVTMRTAGDGRVALKVSTWAKLVQLNFLRRFLGGGFLKHTHGNELFKEAFSYGADEGKVLSVSRRKGRGNGDHKASHNDWHWLCDNVYIASAHRGYDHSEKLLELGWH
ncbi:hypothetical protein QOZ80_2AG0106340 [Eleusine coracana subsp. coracana]|nr:hypothetical protein QOZ80_2AG0106340 [Eleusine coracana subsp. coracana]